MISKKEKNQGSSVVVGISGGVDSMTALFLLKNKFKNLSAVSFLMNEGSDFSIAKEICQKQKVAHEIINIRNEFKSEVIDYFIEEIKTSATPSPCAICNKQIKFPYLLNYADKIGAQFVATGHYARIIDLGDGQLCLAKSRDQMKDQTYFLSLLPKEYLRRIIFPLGENTKAQTYQIAKDNDLGDFDNIKESQEACFFAGRNAFEFINQFIEQSLGDIVDENGNKLGTHKGLQYYTLGQRKGIDLPNGPYFVLKKDLKRNQLVVTKDEKKLFSDSLVGCGVNLFVDIPNDYIDAMVKIRSSQKEFPAKIKFLENKLYVDFETPQRAVTCGQIVAIYDGELCLGGAIICDNK